MPIRFQVDPDFYDHPKTIGMSDSATALWVRAGSYSAAKLTDGFIAEHVVRLLSTVPEEAASELVGRGLWRRVKGGFQFHQWGVRNLTRARVESDREYEREKKRRQRREANNQVKTHSVPDMSPRDSPGNPPGVPAVSMSVSVSESVSGSGRGGATPPHPPPQRCPQHVDDPNPPPCGACADARKAHDRWQADQQRADQARRSAEARARAQATAQAIAACQLCDTHGRLPSGVVCTHDPTRVGSNGAAKARAAIRKGTP
jgi:hypothetical protein